MAASGETLPIEEILKEKGDKTLSEIIKEETKKRHKLLLAELRGQLTDVERRELTRLSVIKRRRKRREKGFMSRRDKDIDEPIFPSVIDIDFNQLDILRQVSSLCWAESSLVALFMAPAVRDYVWSKTFQLKPYMKNGKRIWLPLRTIYPTFSNYNPEYLKYVLSIFGIKYTNDDEMVELFRALSTYLFIVVEKFRHILYNYITQEGGKEVDLKCEKELQNILCSDEFPELKEIMGCRSINIGGFYTRFTVLLKYGYNLNCLSIRSLIANTGIQKPLFPVSSSNNFSTIVRFSLFNGKTETNVGHIVSYFTDKDSKQGVVYFDNEALFGTTFTPAVSFYDDEKTFEEKVNLFKEELNRRFGKVIETGESYEDKSITATKLTHAFIIEYAPDLEHIELTLKDIPMTKKDKDIIEKSECKIDFIYGDNYENLIEFYNIIPRANMTYKGKLLVPFDYIQRLFEKPEELGEGIVAAAGGGGGGEGEGEGDYSGGKRKNVKTRRSGKKSRRKTTRNNGSKRNKRKKTIRKRKVKRGRQTKRSHK